MYKSSFRGSVTPVFDPLTNSILISDGWGSNYSGMRLRRLLVGNGQEDTSAEVRDSVCSIIFSENEESLFVALPKRIVDGKPYKFRYCKQMEESNSTQLILYLPMGEQFTLHELGRSFAQHI